MPDQEMFRVINELTSRVNDVTRRLRDLEERYNETVNTTTSLENEILNQKKDISRLEQSIDSRMNDFLSKFGQLENTVNELINQLKRFATKSEVTGIKELLDIYNPLKSKFVTREQVEEMISQKRR